MDNILSSVRRRPARVPTWLAKSLMAATGVMMALFVLAHMIGNLKVLYAPAEMDEYAGWLRNLLVPALPYSGFLWIFRIAMLTALAIHLIAASVLWRRGVLTRTKGAPLRGPSAWGAKLMMPTGVLLAVFLVIHLLDLTIGAIVASEAFAHPDPAFHAAANVVASLSRPLMAVFYFVALAALAVHLAHGLALAVKDLGWTGRATMRFAAIIARLVALAIFVGDGIVVVHALVGGGAL